MISQLQALRQAHHDRDDLAALERFLLDDTAPLPSLDLLERTRLAAYAYTRTPRHHPDKLALRPAFVAATRRHQQAKAALTPLFQAWYAAGIEVLLFKGFYLAEFVYDAPAQRFYGDVDALIDPRHAAAARRIAVSLGWTVVAELTDSTLPHIHELMSLRSPDGMVYLEVHRRILQNYLPVSRLQQRFTDRAWQASVTHPWQGITVRALEPRDNILLGLILNRFWFADRWTFKPHDPLDMQQTMTRHQLSSDDLRRRADELGCRRTLDIFLSRCHPGRGVLHLAPPDKQQQQRWNWQISGERLHPGLERIAGKVLRIPGISYDMAVALPPLLKVLALLRRHQDIRVVLRALDHPVTDRQPSNKELQQVVRGVRWLLRLLRIRSGGNCLPRSLTIFTMLRRRGYPVVFCSGVRKEGAKLEGHAWVELDGRVLEALYEPDNPQRYRVNVRYPQS